MVSVAYRAGTPAGLSDRDIFPINGAFTSEPDHVLTTMEQRSVAKPEALPARRLHLPESYDAPPWLGPLFQRLGTLLVLGPNWDSYGARPVDVDLGVAAILLLARTMRDETPAPTIVPTNRGG